MNSYSDNQLMARVSQDEVANLGILFERYQTKLYNYFLRLLQEPAASEDLVQEVFFRVLKYRQTYKPGVPFNYWIFRIAHNVGCDYFQKNKKDSSIDETKLETNGEDPVGNLEKDHDLQVLKQAFATLSVEKREVLILSRFKDMKYSEIAKLTGSSVAAIKVRVHRALKDLRDGFCKLGKEMAS